MSAVFERQVSPDRLYQAVIQLHLTFNFAHWCRSRLLCVVLHLRSHHHLTSSSTHFNPSFPPPCSSASRRRSGTYSCIVSGTKGDCTQRRSRSEPMGICCREGTAWESERSGQFCCSVWRCFGLHKGWIREEERYGSYPRVGNLQKCAASCLAHDRLNADSSLSDSY